MSYERNRDNMDESNTELSQSFEAACNDAENFDFAFNAEREPNNFANFGVTEEQHRAIFAEHGVPYPGDVVEEIGENE